MPCDLLECRGHVGVRHVFDGDFEVHPVGPLRVVEEPADVVSAIIESHVRDGSLAEGNPPRNDAVLDGGRHGGERRDHHLDVGAGGEDRGSHPVAVLLVLEQRPFGHAALAIIVAGAEPGVVARLFERVVEVSVDEELDAFFDRYLVAADGPVGLGLLAGVEPVDVDERAVAAAKSFTQHLLVGERPFEQGDVAEREESPGTRGCGIPGEDPDGILLVRDKSADNGYPLSPRAADDEDGGGGMRRHGYDSRG